MLDFSNKYNKQIVLKSSSMIKYFDKSRKNVNISVRLKSVAQYFNYAKLSQNTWLYLSAEISARGALLQRNIYVQVQVSSYIRLKP